MSGLILLFALGICFWLGGMLVRWVGQMVPNPKWQGPAKTTVALALIASPFVDEVIGMYQFNALCKANGIESADVSRAVGKSVVRDPTKFERIQWEIMPMKYSRKIYRDADTGEVLIEFNDYYASGGWVMRYLFGFSGGDPMFFDGNTCGVNQVTEVFLRNKISRVN